MAKTELFTKSFDKSIEVEFARDPGGMESSYNVRVIKEPAQIPLTMKKNTIGHWGIENRISLPPWVTDLEPQLIRAIKENEA